MRRLKMTFLTSVFFFSTNLFGQGLPTISADGIFDTYWQVGNDDFIVFNDSSQAYTGQKSIRVQRGVANTKNTFGGFGTCFASKPYTGKVMKFSGKTKVASVKDGYAGLWARMDINNTDTLILDNMHDRGLTGNSSWTHQEILMYVPSNVQQICLGGILVNSNGIAHFDSLFVEFLDVVPNFSTTL